MSEPPKEDERKQRVLPRGLFPQPPKAKFQCVEILSQSGLHNPLFAGNDIVGLNTRETIYKMVDMLQITSTLDLLA